MILGSWVSGGIFNDFEGKKNMFIIDTFFLAVRVYYHHQKVLSNDVVKKYDIICHPDPYVLSTEECGEPSRVCCWLGGNEFFQSLLQSVTDF